METAASKIKAGSYTLAVGLIAAGAGLLASNLGFLESGMVLKLWPLLLIGLGLEYFIRKLTAGEKEVQFSIPSSVLVGLIAVSALTANTLYSINPGKFLDDGFFRNGSVYTREWKGEPVVLDKGSSLEIKNRMGDVNLTASKDGRLHLSARIEARGASGERARAAAENKKIYVETGPVTRVYTGEEGAFNENNVSVSLQLEVPAGLHISASNKMGGILAQNTSAEDLSLETSLGSIEVDDHTGNLKAKSNMGEIKIKNIKGDIEIEESMGRTKITDPLGNVSAFSRNGSIELASDKPLDKRYVLKGDNGEITLRLPRNSDLKVEASNNHGSISGMESYRDSQGNNTKGELTLGGGTGSALLEIKFGAIRVIITDS